MVQGTSELSQARLLYGQVCTDPGLRLEASEGVLLELLILRLLHCGTQSTPGRRGFLQQVLPRQVGLSAPRPKQFSDPT